MTNVISLSIDPIVNQQFNELCDRINRKKSHVIQDLMKVRLEVDKELANLSKEQKEILKNEIKKSLLEK